MVSSQQNWTGGQDRQYEDLAPQQQAQLRPPIDSMDDLFKTHDLAYSAARVGLTQATAEATRARNEALRNATTREQVRDANKQYNDAVRDAQQQYRRALNQADSDLLRGLERLNDDSSHWNRPAPNPTMAAKKRSQAHRAISAQRSIRAD